MAFAHKILLNEIEKEKFLLKGYNALDQVEKKDDKDYCKSELEKIK